MGFTLVAVYGCVRLRADLKHDDDGKETWAQRLLEIYFWGGALLSLALLALGATHLVRAPSRPPC